MDFIDEIRALGKTIPSISGKILTEEGTKNALVMPFIKILGYDPSNIDEVNPELIADVGTKKGEKVDYAIMKEGKPVILFECKIVNTDLNKEHASQLIRYFTNTPASIGILTNGIIYRFFTDLDEPNLMDEKPFLEINLLDIKEPLIAELKKFSKQELDLEQLESNATQLKYTREIIQKLNNEFSNPSDDFVELFARQVYPKTKKLMPKTREKFKKITKESLDQFLEDKIKQTLKSAIESASTKQPVVAPIGNTPQPITETEDEGKLVTTDDEWEGFYFVKAILHDLIVDSSRIVIRDLKSYCAILLDDNNRKPICRFYFTPTQKQVVVFDNDLKDGNKIPIKDLNELFKLAEHFKGAVAKYDKK